MTSMLAIQNGHRVRDSFEKLKLCDPPHAQGLPEAQKAVEKG